ncbi:hypothetical protein R1sor_001576 [Riccia sorocarpa]|uniref:BPL/LPL catalytic domain-containing protein n=1 Tax=Riccia sorocarpa TaxID=122646 RepID=A0ABD3H296_9MARC
MSGRVVNGARPLMRVLKLSNFPIFQQLKLEERLLRKSSDNWCLLNDGTSPPSIVMGISGKAEKLLEVEKVVKDGVPVIKRFSGGGTVIVDEGTVFITLICSRSALPGLELYPREIMSWTELLYVPVFENALGFKLREHDYVFNDRKFGGNAQSIIKDRWLHHTSFLWDFRDSRMAYLKLPERAPVYREGRNHTDFICRLREHFPSRDIFIDTVQAGLERHFFLREESLFLLAGGATRSERERALGSVNASEGGHFLLLGFARRIWGGDCLWQFRPSVRILLGKNILERLDTMLTKGRHLPVHQMPSNLSINITSQRPKAKELMHEIKVHCVTFQIFQLSRRRRREEKAAAQLLSAANASEGGQFLLLGFTSRIRGGDCLWQFRPSVRILPGKNILERLDTMLTKGRHLPVHQMPSNLSINITSQRPKAKELMHEIKGHCVTFQIFQLSRRREEKAAVPLLSAANTGGMIRKLATACVAIYCNTSCPLQIRNPEHICSYIPTSDGKCYRGTTRAESSWSWTPDQRSFGHSFTSPFECGEQKRQTIDNYVFTVKCGARSEKQNRT